MKLRKYVLMLAVLAVASALLARSAQVQAQPGYLKVTIKLTGKSTVAVGTSPYNLVVTNPNKVKLSKAQLLVFPRSAISGIRPSRGCHPASGGAVGPVMKCQLTLRAHAHRSYVLIGRFTPDEQGSTVAFAVRLVSEHPKALGYKMKRIAVSASSS